MTRAKIVAAVAAALLALFTTVGDTAPSGVHGGGDRAAMAAPSSWVRRCMWTVPRYKRCRPKESTARPTPTVGGPLTPTPVPTRTPTPEPCGLECTVDRVIAAEGMAWAESIWHCLIYHESKWNPWATGAAGERGLLQIHPVHASWSDWGNMYDPAVNVRTGIAIYRSSGWDAWTTHWSCGV